MCFSKIAKSALYIFATGPLTMKTFQFENKIQCIVWNEDTRTPVLQKSMRARTTFSLECRRDSRTHILYKFKNKWIFSSILLADIYCESCDFSLGLPWILQQCEECCFLKLKSIISHASCLALSNLILLQDWLGPTVRQTLVQVTYRLQILSTFFTTTNDVN